MYSSILNNPIIPSQYGAILVYMDIKKVPVTKRIFRTKSSAKSLVTGTLFYSTNSLSVSHFLKNSVNPFFEHFHPTSARLEVTKLAIFIKNVVSWHVLIVKCVS